MSLVDELNEVADKIREHLAAGGGILDDSDHEKMMEIIEMGISQAQWEENDVLWKAIQRAEKAMRDWNDEEYPSAGDIVSGMFPDGTDDGFYDED